MIVFVPKNLCRIRYLFSFHQDFAFFFQTEVHVLHSSEGTMRMLQLPASERNKTPLSSLLKGGGKKKNRGDFFLFAYPQKMGQEGEKKTPPPASKHMSAPTKKIGTGRESWRQGSPLFLLFWLFLPFVPFLPPPLTSPPKQRTSAVEDDVGLGLGF